jgi:hypothetical protein
MSGNRIGVLRAAAGLAVGLMASSAFASVGGPSIGVKFGTDQPNSTMAATDVAGVVPTANWTNASGVTGNLSNLMADVNGVATATATSVTWTSNNTWASTGIGEENNNFTGANKTLMTGYLDNDPAVTATINVTFSGLPTSVVPNYTAIVYFLGGSGGRGGNYQANGTSPVQVGDVATTGFNGPAFVLDPGVDHNDKGNFLVFTNLTGTDLTITATALATAVDPASFRAPINAIEIVPTSAVPEPMGISLAFLGLGGLALRRQRRA